MAQNSHNMAIFPHFLAFLVTFLVVRTTFMRLTSTERTQRPVTVLEQTLSRVDVPYGRPTRTDSICPAAQVLNCVENWNCVEKSWTTAIRSRPPQPSGLSTTATHWLLTTTTATYSDHGFSLRLWLVWYLDLDNYFCENDLWFVLQWKCYDYNDKMFKDLELDFARTTCDPLLLLFFCCLDSSYFASLFYPFLLLLPPPTLAPPSSRRPPPPPDYHHHLHHRHHPHQLLFVLFLRHGKFLWYLRITFMIFSFFFLFALGWNLYHHNFLCSYWIHGLCSDKIQSKSSVSNISSQVSLQNQRSISCTNITQLVSHTYETCFGKSLFLMETTIFDLKPDALRTLFCAFLCLAPQMTSHTKLIHSLGGLDIFLRHKSAHS